MSENDVDAIVHGSYTLYALPVVTELLTHSTSLEETKCGSIESISNFELLFAAQDARDLVLTKSVSILKSAKLLICLLITKMIVLKELQLSSQHLLRPKDSWSGQPTFK